jgi:hypothetical protein
MSTKKKTTGMFECEFIKELGSHKKEDKEIYHASTANTLEAKGFIKIVKEIKKFVPKTMKQ